MSRSNAIRGPETGASAEAALLLACARTHMSDDTRERVHDLVRRDLDWSSVTERALQHKVLSLVYRSLSATCRDAVPAQVLEQYERHFNAVARRNRIRSQELCRLVEHLAKRGVPCVPFKGPTLAAAAYKDLALREFGDLDILVRREDVFEVQEVLELEGYTPQNPITGPSREAYRQSDYYLFIRQDGTRRFRIDVQWRLIGESFELPLDTLCSWNELAQVSLEGATLRSFRIEDLLLILSVHGGKHHWERLSWIGDVAETVLAHPDLEWDRLTAKADGLGMRRMLAVSLALGKNLLDAPIPATVWQQVQSDARAIRLAAPICAHFRRLEGNRLSEAVRLEFRLDVRERWRDRLRYAVHLARRPDKTERWARPLVACLSCLYHLLRPFRPVWQYGARRIGAGRHRAAS